MGTASPIAQSGKKRLAFAWRRIQGAGANVGVELAVGRADDLDDPVLVTPEANAMVSFPGECVHWVRPLHAGERLSVVIGFY